MGRITTLTKLQTGDANLDRLQEHIRAVVNPVLAQPQFSAADFRWTQLNGADQTVADTWTLQFRTTGTTWTTILSVTSTGQIVQPAWIAPTLLNSWVNFDTVNNSIAGYYKDSLGTVHLRGTIKSGVVGIGTAVFTLPSGYRPTKGMNFPVVSNAAFGYVFIDSSGNLQVGSGSNVYVDLDGITFDTRS